MADPLFIIATLVAKPGQADALRQLLLPAVHAFRAEDGCLSYALHEDTRQPGRFVTYESWRDEAALEAHMQSPTLMAAGPQLALLQDGALQQQFLKPLLQL